MLERIAAAWLSRPKPKVDLDAIDTHRGFLLPTDVVLTFYRHKEPQ